MSWRFIYNDIIGICIPVQDWNRNTLNETGGSGGKMQYLGIEKDLR